MKVLLLGNARLFSAELAQRGHRVTLDPGDLVDAAVSDAAACAFAPEGVPLIVLGTGTVADWAVKQKRPDAAVVGSPEEVYAALGRLGVGPAESGRVEPEGGFALTYSNKGGVGKTTAAVSIAQVLAECGVKTVVCDFDVGGPDVASYFDLKPERGLESLRERDVFSLLVRVSDRLWVLPGPVAAEAPRFSGEELLAAVSALRREFVVVGDTPPAPWEKEFLHPLFAEADIVFAVVDQSKFSVKETEAYAPTLLAMGVVPERIRIVVNRYTPKLASLREIERAFCAGFRKGVKQLPRIAAAVPEGWEEQVRAGYRGELLNREEWFKAARELVGSITLPVAVPQERRGERRERRGGLLGWLRA